MKRPTPRWLEDAEEDLWDMTVRRSRQKTVDREEWVSVMKEANGLREKQIIEVSPI
jgi:hypothetical protein